MMIMKYHWDNTRWVVTINGQVWGTDPDLETAKTKALTAWRSHQ